MLARPISICSWVTIVWLVTLAPAIAQQDDFRQLEEFRHALRQSRGHLSNLYGTSINTFVEAGVKHLQGDPGGQELGVRHAREMRSTLTSDLDRARDLVRPLLETDYKNEARVWIFFIDRSLERQFNRHLDEWEAIFNRTPNREQMLRRNFLDRWVSSYMDGVFERASAAHIRQAGDLLTRIRHVNDLLNRATGHREMAIAAIYRAAAWAGTTESFRKEEIDRARREIALSEGIVTEALQAIDKERAEIERSQGRDEYAPKDVILADLDAFERAGKTDMEFLSHLHRFTSEENFASIGLATRLIHGPAWLDLYDRMIARDDALAEHLEPSVDGAKKR